MNLNKKVDTLVEEGASTRLTMSALEAQMQALQKLVERQDMTSAFIEAKCSSGHKMQF